MRLLEDRNAIKVFREYSSREMRVMLELKAQGSYLKQMAQVQSSFNTSDVGLLTPGGTGGGGGGWGDAYVREATCSQWPFYNNDSHDISQLQYAYIISMEAYPDFNLV